MRLQNPTDEKPKVASKTLWANYIACAIAVIGALVGQDMIKEYPQWAAAGAALLAALNVVLRHLTDQPVAPVAFVKRLFGMR